MDGIRAHRARAAGTPSDAYLTDTVSRFGAIRRVVRTGTDGTRRHVVVAHGRTDTAAVPVTEFIHRAVTAPLSHNTES